MIRVTLLSQSGNGPVSQLASSNWKERLAGMESLMNTIKVMEPKDFQCQVLVGIIIKKPGLKDTNFQVLTLAFINQSPLFGLIISQQLQLFLYL